MNAVRHLFVLLAGSALVAGTATFVGAQAGKTADLLNATQVQELVATARTPADHLTLTRHFTALAVKYEADARDHVIVAAAYRRSPTASDSKRPGAPDTALHCDRLTALARTAAKHARELAAEHQAMADRGQGLAAPAASPRWSYHR